MPAIEDHNSAAFWRQRALAYSASYLRAQEAVERVEKAVLDESPNRQLTAARLKEYYDPETGRMYKNLCDLRDMRMGVATHAALMALMLQGR